MLDMVKIKKLPNINFTGCIGMYTPSGWDNIVTQLFHIISNYAEKHNITVDVIQVKEKFGALRFYFRTENPKHSEIIGSFVQYAEWLTETSCITCGKNTEPKNHAGFYAPICKDCQ